ncbi:MAG: OmpH family outer membrane protein [Muribaculaceae bacterium]
MIKKILLAIAIALPTFASAQKFGTVNTQTLLEAMPETAAANTQLEAAAKKYEDEFKKLQDEFQKKYTEFQQLEETTPQSIKDRRMQELQEQSQRMEQFRSTAAQDIDRQQQTLMQPITEKLQKAIQAVGAANNFTMIFPAGMSLYNGSDVQDITALVKTELGIK